MKILLIEPAYKNKYPPIGLMKIATFHKSRGDYVKFYKGILEENLSDYDMIYITTLFSFEFKITIETIRYYEAEASQDTRVIVGGISATIMQGEYNKEILGKAEIVPGQLSSSSILGFKCNTDIDNLITDYDILDDIDYQYPEEDSYYLHLSRGCIRKCDFCAVSILEPRFQLCKNQLNKIEMINKKYGVKKYLKIMDNNILYLKEFPLLVDDMVKVGFGNKSEPVLRELEIEKYLTALERRLLEKQDTDRVREKIINLTTQKVNYVLSRTKNAERIRLLENFTTRMGFNLKNDTFFLANKSTLISIFMMYYSPRRIKQKVDFNQGLDARAFSKKDRIEYDLAKLDLEVCRIAFDDLGFKNVYLEAMEKCYKAGIRKFSNYLLYNYEDTPEDLYERMRINIEFCDKHNDINLFSFPMKYVPVTAKDRSFIGEEWSKLELNGFSAIINVTRGVVAKEKDFFDRAYGSNSSEFQKIILMPHEFIKKRKKYEDNNLIEIWKNNILSFSDNDLRLLKSNYSSGNWENALHYMKNFYFVSLHKKITV